MNKQKQIEDAVQQILRQYEEFVSLEYLKKLFSIIDLTSLNADDNEIKIVNICKKLNDFKTHFDGVPQVAAICTYPNFITTVKNNLKDTSVKIASVAGGFPSSQTYIEIKLKETEQALSDGADEIDIVLPVGKFLAGKETEISNEIRELKKLMGDKHLKVILETGILNDYELINNASVLAMESGADFIKTSTGKNGTGATPEAIFVMADSIKTFYKNSGRKIGIKPAGGISSSSNAIQFLFIIKEILGDEWVNKQLFRIGASRLTNDLLTEITSFKKPEKISVQYF